MSISDIINCALCILSFILAAVSVVTVVVTLRQNNKMLEADARPYVVVYFSYDEYAPNLFLCIRNFGKTAAIIDSLTILPSVQLMDQEADQLMKNVMIAPTQQVHFLLLGKEHSLHLNSMELNHQVTIQYHDCTNHKRYCETYHANVEYTKRVMSVHSKQPDLTEAENALIAIDKSLTAIKNKML